MFVLLFSRPTNYTAVADWVFHILFRKYMYVYTKNEYVNIERSQSLLILF